MTVLNEKQVYELWVKAWNEDVSVLDEITAFDCTLHRSGSDEEKGAEGLKKMIRDGCSYFDNVEMTIEVGLIVDSPYVSASWQFKGAYKGGIPDTKAEMGKEISFCGMDIFLVKDGKITDYWVSTDDMHFMKQLN
ncbi:ester cyclase [Lacicoccus qingdaonensis]|uniref:Predicted ester cyclase n=1 Tax=Lacicoccus qingdaonensis TaxID=576118 RepID=A0A1G9DIB1_9BACL|nr:ester cyclase [Salinicoccus qingdaonensis]SDK63609.1 Predicted ester cyclase [Salinicoccus qingdaonensis]